MNQVSTDNELVQNSKSTVIRCDPEMSDPCGSEGLCFQDFKTKVFYCKCRSDLSVLPSSQKCPAIANNTPNRVVVPKFPASTSAQSLSLNKDTGLRKKYENNQLIQCNPNNGAVCGPEAACEERNNTYQCICAQTGTPAPPDRKCPRKTVPLVNGAYQNVKLEVFLTRPTVESVNIVNSADSTSTTKPSVQYVHNTHTTPSTNMMAIYLSSGLLLVIITIIIAWKIFYYQKSKERKKARRKKALAIPLRKNIILEERYTSNPHYTSAGGPADTPVAIVPILLRSDLKDLEKIGEGYFGKVYKGQLCVSGDSGVERVETVAVKMLKQTTNLEAEEDFIREVEIMSSFDHPNILSLIGFCPREHTNAPWMVFEFMPFGDLASVLRNSGHPFWVNIPSLPVLSKESLLSIALQISEGMAYLARQRFVHRDLACRNCLVGCDLVVKISDFGMSRDVYTCDYYKIGGTRMLPVRWMAPESIVFGKFTLESDVWSYGVVLWEIYNCGKQPYYGHTNEEVLRFILDGVLLSLPEECPNEIVNIMNACWKKDTKERILFSDICDRLKQIKENMLQQSEFSLPRPPPLPVTVDLPALFEEKVQEENDEAADELLDEDNYLRPRSRSESLTSADYLETLLP